MNSLLRFILILAFLLFVGGTGLLMCQLPWWGWTIPLGLLLRLRPNIRHWWAHGTAAFASYLDVAHAQMLDGDGVPVGLIECRVTKAEGVKALFDRHLSARRAVEACLAAFRGKRKKPRQMVRLNRSHHVAIFAPTGAGKNVSIVEPFLFSSRASAIVVDVKGENCHLTSGHREMVFGQHIIRLDPWKLTTAAPACWNVLDLIDPTDPESLDQIRALAEAMIEKQPGGEREPHWPQRAQLFITGGMAAVVFCCAPSLRNLPMVAKILANKVLLDKAMTDLCHCPAHGGLVAQIGHEMNVSVSRKADGSWSSENRELESILSTVSRFLTFLNTPAVVESTSATRDCDVNALYKGHGATIYLIIPLHYLTSHAPLLRLWLTALTQHTVKRGIKRRHPVHLILDECGTALDGHGKALEQMLSVGRGYGLKVMAIFQAMGQLSKVVSPGQEGVFLANTTQVFFGVNDFETAQYVSNQLGKRTILTESWGDGENTGGGYGASSGAQGGSQSTNTNWGRSSNRNLQQAPRELLKPEEVCGLSERVAIIIGAPGVRRPLWTWLTRYYEKPPRIGIGPIQSFVDAACKFLFAALIAAFSTAALCKGSFQMKGEWHGQRAPARHRQGAPANRGAASGPGGHEGVRRHDEGNGRKGLGRPYSGR